MHLALPPSPPPPGPQLRPCLNVKYISLFLNKFDKLSIKLTLKAEPMHPGRHSFPHND